MAVMGQMQLIGDGVDVLKDAVRTDAVGIEFPAAGQRMNVLCGNHSHSPGVVLRWWSAKHLDFAMHSRH